MLTKDIRKGTRVILRNGWKARIEDNQTRQSTRMATVYGIFTDMGSIYSTDIEFVITDAGIVRVELTDKQKESVRQRALLGF